MSAMDRMAADFIRKIIPPERMQELVGPIFEEVKNAALRMERIEIRSARIEAKLDAIARHLDLMECYPWTGPKAAQEQTLQLSATASQTPHLSPMREQ